MIFNSNNKVLKIILIIKTTAFIRIKIILIKIQIKEDHLYYFIIYKFLI